MLASTQQLLQQSNPNPELLGAVGADLVAEAQLLDHAGVQLGARTTFQLQVALRNLAKEKALVDARFFGKVLGTQRDYFVIEAKADAGGEEAAPGSDAAGTGVNAVAFYVSHAAAGPWTRLPDIGAQLIVNARGVHRLFTGHLDSPLGGFNAPLVLMPKRPPPPPYGSSVTDMSIAAAAVQAANDDAATFTKYNTERYLLRAQLARISAATVVAPANAWEKKDGEDAFSRVDAPAKIDAAEYASLGKWLHVRAHLYANGRTKVADAENPDVDTGGVAPFRSLAESTGDGGAAHWAARLTPHLSLDLHPAAMVKSLTWPGAVAVAKGTAHACVYVGNGIPRSATLFTPPPPPHVQAEYAADAEYVHKPAGGDDEAAAAANAPAPRPPLQFATDVSVDPRPPPPAEEAPAAE